MTKLYAQPYDISANGFYFESKEEYEQKSACNFNSFGALVDEYEIQFIDGEAIDAELFDALKIHQGDFHLFFDVCNHWYEHQKQKVIIAVGKCSYSFDLKTGDPDDLEVDIYEMDRLRDLGEYFVEEGLFGDVPERLKYYLDYEAIARDLSMDYTEICIAGKRLIYRSD